MKADEPEQRDIPRWIKPSPRTVIDEDYWKEWRWQFQIIQTKKLKMGFIPKNMNQKSNRFFTVESVKSKVQ